MNNNSNSTDKTNSILNERFNNNELEINELNEKEHRVLNNHIKNIDISFELVKPFK